MMIMLVVSVLWWVVSNWFSDGDLDFFLFLIKIVMFIGGLLLCV